MGERKGQKRATEASGPGRALVITPWWPTADGSSVGNFVYDQGEAFIATGLELDVLHINSALPGKTVREKPKPLKGARIFQLSLPHIPERFGLARVSWQLKRLALKRHLKAIPALREIRHRFIQHNSLDIAVLFGGVLDQELLSGDRHFCTVHGEDPNLATRAGDAWFAGELHQFFETQDTVVPVGKVLIPYLKKLGAKSEQIHVIQNGFRAETEGFRVKETAADGTIGIISISNLSPIKGIDLNIRALADLQRLHPNLSWTYNVVGDGPMRPQLERLAKDFKLEDRIKFHGRLDRRRTMLMLSESDIFSMPSSQEAFGIVYLEAMSMGKPVIGCRGQGAEETVEDGANGHLIPPRDVGALTGALHRLATDKALRDRMGHLGKVVSTQFTWQRNVNRYLALYDAAQGLTANTDRRDRRGAS